MTFELEALTKLSLREWELPWGSSLFVERVSRPCRSSRSTETSLKRRLLVGNPCNRLYKLIALTLTPYWQSPASLEVLDRGTYFSAGRHSSTTLISLLSFVSFSVVTLSI